MSLLITKAKPNPAGKDRVGQFFTPATQLAAEWVDFQNITATPINITGVQMYHLAYLQNGSTEWELAIELSGTIQSGEIVRVHSGNPIPLAQMNYEDQTGANYHVFTGKNYIWNNHRIDRPGLWYKPNRQWIDQTDYDAPVGEGRILQRINKKLI
jgi:hypothetical protein